MVKFAKVCEARPTLLSEFRDPEVTVRDFWIRVVFAPPSFVVAFSFSPFPFSYPSASTPEDGLGPKICEMHPLRLLASTSAPDQFNSYLFIELKAKYVSIEVH